MSTHKFPDIKTVLAAYFEQFYDDNVLMNGTSPNMQLFIDNTEEEQSNIEYWMKNFYMDDLPTPMPSDSDNDAPYAVESAVKKMASMMDWASPHSETNQRTKGGHRKHASTIPRFNVGDLQTAMSLKKLKALAERYGNDEKVMSLYKNTIIDGINAGHYALNRMAADSMSTGTISGWGLLAPSNPLTHGMYPDQFITPDVDLQDADTDLLDWIQDFVAQLNQTFSTKFAWEIQAADTWIKDVFMQNNQVISEIGSWKARQDGNGTTVLLLNSSGDTNPANVTPKNFTIDDVVAYSQDPLTSIPPIAIQVEYQNEETTAGVTTGRGWNVNNIAFKPVGMSGVIKWTDIPEIALAQEFGAPNVPSTYAYALGGIIGIINSVMPVGRLSDYHQDFYMGARPQLLDFQYRYIVYTDRTSA